MDTYTWLTTLFILVVTSRLDAQKIILRAGRHVCTQQRVVMTPVTVLKSVCVPYYRRMHAPCPNNKQEQCQHLRMVYRREFRQVTQMLPQRHVMFTCCPGWTGYNVVRSACPRPVCNPGCEHGGMCRLPNRCMCKNGWNGNSCQSDVDECAANPCDQKCVNSGGSYKCDCYQGYRLEQDGRTCTLCLSCTDEFTKILQDQKELQKTVIRLEENNQILQDNLTKLSEDLSNLTSMTLTDTASAVTVTSTTTTSRPSTTDSRGVTILNEELEAILSSLSEQIAMFEERLDGCTCSQKLPALSRVVLLPPRHKFDAVTLSPHLHKKDLSKKRSRHKPLFTGTAGETAGSTSDNGEPKGSPEKDFQEPYYETVRSSYDVIPPEVSRGSTDFGEATPEKTELPKDKWFKFPRQPYR